jgi:hypothetical protein
MIVRRNKTTNKGAKVQNLVCLANALETIKGATRLQTLAAKEETYCLRI